MTIGGVPVLGEKGGKKLEVLGPAARRGPRRGTFKEIGSKRTSAGRRDGNVGGNRNMQGFLGRKEDQDDWALSIPHRGGKQRRGGHSRFQEDRECFDDHSVKQMLR